MNRICFLFSGQGSQYVGLGKELFQTFPVARDVFEEANDILGSNFSKIMFEGPEEELLQTVNSQLALYIQGIALSRVLNANFPDIKPVCTLGLSLGEYTALTAAKKINFTQTLPIIKLRGELMNEACLKAEGRMSAVLGLEVESIEEILKNNDLKEVWIANYNTPLQTVISGKKDCIEKASKVLKNSGVRKIVPLNVFGAFHSPLMESVRKPLKEAILEKLSFTDSGIKIIMNSCGEGVDSLEAIKDYLCLQVTSPVFWFQSIRFANTLANFFLEIGAGKVLSNLNKQIGVKGKTLSLESCQDFDKLELVLKGD